MTDERMKLAEAIEARATDLHGAPFDDLIEENWKLIVAALRAPEAPEAGILAWIEYAENGNIRFWTDDAERGQKERAKGRYLHSMDLGGLMTLVSLHSTAAGVAAPPPAETECDPAPRGTNPRFWTAADFEDDARERSALAAPPEDETTAEQAEREWHEADAAPPAASVDAVRERLHNAVAEGNRQYWRDSAKQSAAFDEWKGGGFVGDCPQCCKGSLLDYITETVLALSAPVAGADAGMRERAGGLGEPVWNDDPSLADKDA